MPQIEMDIEDAMRELGPEVLKELDEVSIHIKSLLAHLIAVLPIKAAGSVAFTMASALGEAIALLFAEEVHQEFKMIAMRELGNGADIIMAADKDKVKDHLQVVLNRAQQYQDQRAFAEALPQQPPTGGLH